jgi:amino acid adenylation domain-containing protein
MATPRLLHELVGARSALAPDAVAVVDGDAELTYAEMSGRARRLAQRLQCEGIGPEHRVGVCMDRSIGLVVAFLGVLEAGGVYVPLDPTYPAEALARVVGDARPDLLVVDGRAPRPLVEACPAAVLPLEPGGETADPGGAPATATLHPDNAAYIFYTSGSTGRPKGVVVAHRAASNHTTWVQDRLDLRPDDRVLQKTPLGFDPSITELLAPLVSGGQLVLARNDAHQDPQYLVDTIASERISVLQVVPTLLRLLLDQPDLERCSSLRMVLSGGEALPTDLVRRLQDRLPVHVHNLYGPTETTIDVTCQIDVEPGERDTVPIGLPVSATAVHVLDADMQPVPDGASGELYVGGVQVARGYLDRPGLTADRFVPDPFGVPGGARLYRTGDLVRRLSDGACEYVGRTDDQIKVRGVRVEPREIEAALCADRRVRGAVVVAADDWAPGPRLVAYVVVDGGAEGDLARELQRGLQAQLPPYLASSSVTMLDGFPRTPSGKLDRSALPRPAAAATPTEYVAPRTALEADLAGAFAGLLGIDRLGIHDPVIELGADSLVVAQMGTHVTRAHDVHLPLFVLFATPTVAGVAEAVEAYRRAGAGHLEALSASSIEDEARLDSALVPDWAR